MSGRAPDNAQAHQLAIYFKKITYNVLSTPPLLYIT